MDSFSPGLPFQIITLQVGPHFLFWFLCWAFMGFIYGFLHTGENRIQYFALSYLEALLYLLSTFYWVTASSILSCTVYFKGRYCRDWRCDGPDPYGFILSPLILTFVINPIRLVLNSPAGVGPSRTIFLFIDGGLRGSMTVPVLL